MYRFTAEFKTIGDLIAFTNTLGVGQVNKLAEAKTEVKTEEVEFHAEKPPVIEEKPKAAKVTKPKAEKAPVKEEMIEVESPYAKTAPIEPEVVFDRAAALAKATELVGQLKASGIADGDLMPKIHEVYALAGCPNNLKIGQFDDSALSRFIPLFEQKVASIVNTPTSSFI